MKKYYLSGPMRGYPEHNFPAFDKAAAILRKYGYEVISPAEMDRLDPKTSGALAYARRDCDALLNQGVTHIYMMKNWEKSIGARAEFALASWIGLEIEYE
jgi:hypothetical protein